MKRVLARKKATKVRELSTAELQKVSGAGLSFVWCGPNKALDSTDWVPD